MTIHRATVIGAGLAGSEATSQLVRRGIAVDLHEMRPTVMTKAHRTEKFAELVCSNSFRGADLTNAVGLLKEELRIAQSLIMESAEHSKVPAGGALAVDRDVFSNFIDERLRNHPLVTLHTGEIKTIPEATRDHPVIIATGPLTGHSLALELQRLVGSGNLAFFDAISPIIAGDSIDLEKVFRQSRYDKGDGDDYLNIPLSEEGYNEFISAIEAGEKFGGHAEVESDFVADLRPFEGCMPIEEMVERGRETLRFGPLKPVGITDPKTGQQPHAVIQLRQDNLEGTLWSMVGMQTRLKHPEQLRIFRSLPGLENAEFVRLGTVHRNTFIDSPKCLNPTLEFRGRPGLFMAGQITGVEGYVESTAGGLVAGMNAARAIAGLEPIAFPKESAIGSLMSYISDTTRKQFQPMNISFGLMPSYIDSGSAPVKRSKRVSKSEKRMQTADRAIQALRQFFDTNEFSRSSLMEGTAENFERTDSSVL